MFLDNVHLMQGWIPRLERKLEIASESAHPDFRCFFSAEPINGAPQVCERNKQHLRTAASKSAVGMSAGSRLHVSCNALTCKVGEAPSFPCPIVLLPAAARPRSSPSQSCKTASRSPTSRHQT